LKTIFFTVTNDLNYDQRMHRICGSLQAAGFPVTLVGREWPHSRPLEKKTFGQVRLRCRFNTGFLFYAEYNIRLFFFLLRQDAGGICAIDLDTILPCLAVSRWKRIPRIYDAHEYFTELKEVRSRPFVRRAWKAIERIALPRFRLGYTVSPGLADAFEKAYGHRYQVIRNLPLLREEPTVDKEDFLLYQGAVNEGRGFEYLLPALEGSHYRLVVCGDGNFMEPLKELVQRYRLTENVILKGMMLPEALRAIAPRASLGMGLADREGINQFLALPNKFFDYMHACVPQLAMNYPEYRAINQQYGVACLIDDLQPSTIRAAIDGLMQDSERLEQMQAACREARKLYCWQEEEKKLIQFYREIFES